MGPVLAEANVGHKQHRLLTNDSPLVVSLGRAPPVHLVVRDVAVDEEVEEVGGRDPP
jgi:hypothetical protein